LRNRKLAEHLYLSEVYKVVEGVRGVENSICEIYQQPSKSDESTVPQALQVIRADNVKDVVYLDTAAEKKPSTLELKHEEYEP
jgi:hypothetical protein